MDDLKLREMIAKYTWHWMGEDYLGVRRRQVRGDPFNELWFQMLLTDAQLEHIDFLYDVLEQETIDPWEQWDEQ